MRKKVKTFTKGQKVKFKSTWNYEEGVVDSKINGYYYWIKKKDGNFVKMYCENMTLVEE